MLDAIRPHESGEQALPVILLEFVEQNAAAISLGELKVFEKGIFVDGFVLERIGRNRPADCFKEAEMIDEVA